MATVPSVLIIDEEPEARFRARQLVQEAGFEAAGEGGLGTEAIALATERRPEMVLCGLGDQTSRALQTIESLVHNLPDTPVVAYSGSSDLHVVRQAMLAGARNFVQWPCKPDELARSLGAALESEERRRLRDSGGAALGPRGAIVTVFGAKGGAGKTTVATNLGVALVRGGERSCVLLDAAD
ncbi:MAG: response regulator [Dehalococcoidia bacterium]